MADENDAPAAPGGNKKKLILFGAVALLVVLGGGVGVMFALGGDDSVAATPATPAKPQEATYIDLEPEFVINFRDRNDRPKFLKAEMSVSTRDDDIERAVERHMPAIRNNLVLLLSRQVYEDLVPNEGKETLRQQALAEVQSVLETQIGKPGVDDLYFSNFVMH